MTSPNVVSVYSGATLLGTYSTIQAAINASGAFDTIKIGAGTYNENVNVTVNGLTIENVSGAQVTIDGIGGYAGAINVASGVSGVTIKSSDGVPANFVVEGSQNANVGQVAALYLVGDNSGIKINGITTVAALTGDAGLNSVLTGGNLNNILFTNNVFSGTADQLVYVNGAEDIGPQAQNGNVNFVGNTFSGSAPGGPLLGMSAPGEVINNTFSGSGSVDVSLNESGVAVTGNTFKTQPADAYFIGDGSYDPQPIQANNTFTQGAEVYVVHNGVRQDGVYSNIQDGINAAVAGDTVFIGNGTYNGNVALADGVNLMGQSEAGVIINGTLSTPTNFDNTTITNLTVNDSSTSAMLLDMTATQEVTSSSFNNVSLNLLATTSSAAILVGNGQVSGSMALQGTGLAFNTVTLNSNNANFANSTSFAYTLFHSVNGAQLVLNGVSLNGTASGTNSGLGAQWNMSPNGGETADVTIENSSTSAGGNFYVSGMASATITGNTFNGQGLALNGVASATVTNNLIENIDGTYTANGTQHRGLVIENAFGATGDSNISVTGNTFSNITATDGAIAFQRFTASVSGLATIDQLNGIDIQGNTFTGLGAGVNPFYLNSTYFGTGAVLPASISGSQLIIGSANSDSIVDTATGPVQIFGAAGIDTVSATPSFGAGYSVSVQNGQWVVSNGVVTDTLSGVEKVVINGATYDLVDHFGANVGGFQSIQSAVNAASVGDTILVASGTYNENVTVNVNNVTIKGSGSGTVIEGTFKSDNGISNGGVAAFLESGHSYTQTAGRGIEVAANNVTVENLNIDSFTYGVDLSDGTSGTTISGVNITDSLEGIRKGTTAGITGLAITGGSISDGLIGIDFDKQTTPGQQSVGNATGVTISGTDFNNLAYKGIYAETLSNADITGITMENVGQYGAPSTSGTTGTSGDGIDLNLKNGTYSNITIENFTLNGVGSSTENGANQVGDTHGGAIVVESRDQGSYASTPATTGAITIQNGTIEGGTSTGIQAGEPGQTNAGPAVNISNVSISGAEQNSLHGDVANVTQSTMTVHMATGDNTFTASPTTTGTLVVYGNSGNDTITTGAGNDTINAGSGTNTVNGAAGINTLVYPGTLTAADFSVVNGQWQVTNGSNGADTLNNITEVSDGTHNFWLVGDGGYASIQTAINAASAGDTVLVAPGSYAENVALKDGVNLAGIGPHQSGVLINGTMSTPANFDNVTVSNLTVNDNSNTAMLLDMTGTTEVTSSAFSNVTFNLNSNSSAAVLVGNGQVAGSMALQGTGLAFNGVTLNSNNYDFANSTAFAYTLFHSVGNAQLVLNGVSLNGTASGTSSGLGAQWNMSPNGGETADVTIENSSTSGGGNFYVSGMASATITNNTFNGQGLALNGVASASVTGNLFENIDGTYTANGTQHRGLVIENAFGATGDSGISVTGNTFSNITATDGAIAFQRWTDSNGNLIPATISTLNDVDIQGNTFTGVNTPIFLNASSFGSSAILPATISGSQLIIATAGNDSITAPTGNASIFADGGVDTVTIAGATAADVTLVNNQWTVTTAQGVETLSNVEEVSNGSGGTVWLVGDGGFSTIQAAVNAASAGDTILIAPGTYAGATISKALTITGSGSGSTLVNSNLATDGFDLTGNINSTVVGGSATVSIKGIGFVDNQTGIYVHSDVQLTNLDIDSSDFEHSKSNGVGMGSGAAGLANIDITNSTFTQNGDGTFNGDGDISLFGFVGNALLKNLVVDGGTNTTPTTSNADFAIQINGRDPSTDNVTHSIGNVVLDNVQVNGSYDKVAVYVQGYTDLNGLDFANSGNGGTVINGHDGWGYGLYLDPTAGENPNAGPNGPGFFNAGTAAAESVNLSNVSVTNDITSFAGIPLGVVINGTPENDTISGLSAGTNYINGSGGLNTVNFTEKLTASDFAMVSGNWEVTTAHEGTNLLQAVEVVTDTGGPTFLLVGAGSTYATASQAFGSAQYSSGDIIIDTAAQQGQLLPTVVATASNVSTVASKTFTASQLFSASVPDNSPILAYEVEDEESTGASNGFWTLNGQVETLGTMFTVTAAQLSLLSFTAGSVSSGTITDTLEVAASDAGGFGAFTTFAVKASAFEQGDTPLTVTASNQVEAIDSTVLASTLFSVSPPQGETVASYEVQDTNGDWIFNGTTIAANQVVDVTVAQLSELSLFTNFGTDTLMVRANDGSQWGSYKTFQVSAQQNAAPVASTTDVMIMDRADGSYDIFDIGHNAITAGYLLGQVPTAYQVVGLGDFSTNVGEADMMTRNAAGAFELYDISNNNVTGSFSMGQVGPEWSAVGFADFSDKPNETDMLLRSTSGAFEVYDIANNSYSGFHSLGQVGPEWSVAGFADFSGNAGETDMLMRNSNSGAFELYDIVNNNYTGFFSMGQVGLDWTVQGFGDFSSNAGETDMLMRNSSGEFELFDIANNQYTGFHDLGNIGLQWQVVGFGDFSGVANETDMLMRNTSTGAFNIYDISHNQMGPAMSIGEVGTEWQVAGVAADPPSSASALFVQGVASVAGSTSASGAGTSTTDSQTVQQNQLLTQPHS